MQCKKKFRYTKQLIGMALRDGWTQGQIADACRTQQSVVSNWKSGAKQANESQLTKLLAIYGPRLHRKSFKIYHDLIKNSEGRYRAHLIKVEGDVILNFPFRNKELCTRCQTEASTCFERTHVKKLVATRRLVIHDLGAGVFCCLSQVRLLQDKYQMQFSETNVFVTQVVGHFTVEELLAYCDSQAWGVDQEEKEHSEVEYFMLAMLARKALLEHGYPVDGVDVHASV